VHFSLSDLAADITQNSAESGASLVELEVRETVTPAGVGGAALPGNAGGAVGADGAAKSEFRFCAKDNGKGMSAAQLDRALDPFVTDGIKHPGRKVGLGIPFLIQTAVDSGGGWRIRSTKPGTEPAERSGGKGSAGADTAGYAGGSRTGTVEEAWFDLANVDTPPLGDIPGLFRSVLLFEGPEEIIIRRLRKQGNLSGKTDSGGTASGGNADLDYEVKKTELTEALGDLESASSLVLLGKYLRSLEGEDDNE
jgi:hypothetical protein